MLYSMTGYGRGEFCEGEVDVNVEIRSLNNRFLDIAIKSPGILANFDQKMKDIVREYVRRGRINVNIVVKNFENKYQGLMVNLDLAKMYFRIVQELRTEFNLEGQIDLASFLAIPEIIAYNNESVDEKCWGGVVTALKLAIEDLQTMRLREGEILKADLARRIDYIDQATTEIEKIAKNRPAEELEKLRQRLKTLNSNLQVEENRLEAEIAILADRLDITEECVRLHTHNQAFLKIMDEEDQPGRRLNFLLQEMHREANTIGAKSMDAKVSHSVVQIKEEIEKIREQVQNVE